VWLQKRNVSAAVLARHMPPWPAFPGYGRFDNENAVTLRESQFLVSWMEGLGPRNAGKVFTNTSNATGPAPPAIRAHVDLDAWPLGQPDLVRELPQVPVDPAAGDEVRRVVVDLGLTADRRVRAVEYVPGDRRVVRAAVFTVQETGQWIASWTPWYRFTRLPESTAYRVPAGAHLAAEIHYQPAKERIVDRGKIGLFFDSQASQTVSDVVVEATGAKRLRGETTLTADTTLLALRPDVGPGISSVEVSARRADGGTEVLLFAKDFSRWLTPYIFAEPVALRKGTKLMVTAYGDVTTMKTTMSTVRFQ
jgi:hypothetical protein